MSLTHRDQPIVDAFRRFAQELGWPKHKIDAALDFAADALSLSHLNPSKVDRDWIIYARDRGFTADEIGDALGFVEAGREIGARVGGDLIGQVITETFPVPSATDADHKRVAEIKQLMASNIDQYWKTPGLPQEYGALLERTQALPRSGE